MKPADSSPADIAAFTSAPARTNNTLAASRPPGATGTQPKPAPAPQNPPPVVVRATKPPPEHPPKGAERLLAASQTASQPLAPDPPEPAADKSRPASMVTIVPGPAGNGLIIKGPPRSPRSSPFHTIPLGYLALAVGLLVGLLVLSAKRRHRSFPLRHSKAPSDGLMMPGDFKMKDSAIQAATPMGILGPERSQRPSLGERFASAGIVAANFFRFILSKVSAKKSAE